MIEHDMPLITKVCDRVHVLAADQTLAEGAPREAIGLSPKVVEELFEAVIDLARRG